MVQRGIDEIDVREVLASGEVIESYPTTRHTCRLALGWRGNRPIHVVAAGNVDAGETIVITVYEPDTSQWKPGSDGGASNEMRDLQAR